MNTKHLLRPAALLLPLVILAGCPSVGNVPQAGGDWHNMGEANNGNFKRNGQLVTFRDRKIVVDMKEERFINVPPYKTAINNWEIHCGNKTFRLTASTLYDDTGKIISDEKYTAVDIRPMAIPPNSLTEEQRKIVCAH